MPNKNPLDKHGRNQAKQDHKRRAHAKSSSSPSSSGKKRRRAATTTTTDSMPVIKVKLAPTLETSAVSQPMTCPRAHNITTDPVQLNRPTKRPTPAPEHPPSKRRKPAVSSEASKGGSSSVSFCTCDHAHKQTPKPAAKRHKDSEQSSLPSETVSPPVPAGKPNKPSKPNRRANELLPAKQQRQLPWPRAHPKQHRQPHKTKEPDEGPKVTSKHNKSRKRVVPDADAAAHANAEPAPRRSKTPRPRTAKKSSSTSDESTSSDESCSSYAPVRQHNHHGFTWPSGLPIPATDRALHPHREHTAAVTSEPAHPHDPTHTSEAVATTGVAGDKTAAAAAPPLTPRPSAGKESDASKINKAEKNQKRFIDLFMPANGRCNVTWDDLAAIAKKC